MEKIKRKATTAAIVLFVIAALSLLLHFIINDDEVFSLSFLLVASIVEAIIGFSTLSIVGNEETMRKNKGWILAFAIVCLIFSRIGAIFLFILHDDISIYFRKQIQNNGPNNVKVKEDKKEDMSPELKKIDILAKLGIGLVVFSGIILSTSKNSLFASDIAKPILMIVLFLLFRFLYYFFENKVVIKSSSKLYYYLSHIFFVLIFVSLGYFKILGEELSFFGYYSKIMTAIVLVSLSFSMFTSARRFPVKYLEEASIFISIIALLLVLTQFEFDKMHIVGILLIISMLLYMFKDKLLNSLSNVNDLLLPIVSIVFMIFFVTSKELLLFELLLGIFIIFLARQRIVNQDKVAYLYRYGLPIFINFFIIFVIYHASQTCDIGTSAELFITPTIFNYRLITVLALLVSCGFFIRGNDKETVYSGLYSSIILSLIVATSLMNYGYSMIGVLASICIFSFVTIILKPAQKEGIRLFCFVAQLVSLLFLSITGLLFYISNGIDAEFDTVISIFIVFTIILNLLEKNVFNEFHLTKIVYYVTIISLLVVNSLFFTNHSLVYNIVMIAIMFIYRRFYRIKEKDKYIFNYLFILCVYLNVSYLLVGYTTVTISSLILLVSLLVYTYYINKEKYTPFFVLLLSYVPYLVLVNEVVLNPELATILTRLPLIVLTFVISRKLLNNKIKENFVFEIIVLSLIFLSYIFEVELVLGLFTFILALIMIYIGFRNEKYNSLFVVGIGATILNIIVQLSDFWASVPLPVYLLVSGLIIIGYVTYKEMNKNKKKEEKPKSPVIEEKPDTRLNGINIILVVITAIALAINLTSIDYSVDNNKRYADREISAKGIDPGKIFIDETNFRIFIEEGYHCDIKTVLDEYGEYKDYIYYKVIYVPEDDFPKVRRSSRFRESLIDYGYQDSSTLKSFDYNGVVERNYNVNGVNIIVKNDVINYLIKKSYDYDTNGDLNLSYNIYDTDKLVLNFKNTEGRNVIVNTNDRENVMVIPSDGTYTIEASDGKVFISVSAMSGERNTNYNYDERMYYSH